MAKQAGAIKYKGTLDDLVGYQRGGDYFFRTKGVYKTRKQMEQQPEIYGRVLEQSSRFKRAANLAGWVWHLYMPKGHRKNGDFGRFTGRANRLVQAGLTDWQILVQLVDYCRELDPQWVASRLPLERTNARQWAQGYEERIQPAVAAESPAPVAEAVVAEAVAAPIASAQPKLQVVAVMPREVSAAAPTAIPAGKALAGKKPLVPSGSSPLVASPPQPPGKPMRILSKWKVNRRGRLQVPKKRQMAMASPNAGMDSCYPEDG